MKRAVLYLVFMGLAASSFGQKFGYVNTEYILTKMPEYSEVQAELDKVSMQWQDEILAMNQDIKAMYDAYVTEEVLLTDEMKTERMAEIKVKEEESKAYQKKVFGYEGLYFLKKKELLKPVQDKLYEAVEKVAKDKRLQMILDKSGDYAIIYSDPIHDYTDFVLEELGLGDKSDVIE
ncbi:MAG: OmpH family outer membrane protein [Cyclobacteriaceae bacterium]